MPIIRDIIYGAAARGVGINDLCLKSGVDVHCLNDSDSRLDFVKAYSVWEHAVNATGDKSLGLHLGESTGPNILGLVGHLMQTSPDLKTSFDNVSRYAELATDMLRYSILDRDQQYVIQYAPAKLWLKQSPDTARQAIEQAMAGTLNVFYLLSGRKVYPVKVKFQHKRVTPLGEFERVFKSSLNFDAGSNELLFDKKDLDQKVLSYDRALFRTFEKLLLQRRSGQMKAIKFSDKLKDIILKDFHGQVPSVEVIASHVRLTTRSLQRRLESEKKTYRDISTALKKDLARQFLTNPDMKVDYISHVLGYSDASSFRRAYKGWTNSTPRKSSR